MTNPLQLQSTLVQSPRVVLRKPKSKKKVSIPSRVLAGMDLNSILPGKVSKRRRCTKNADLNETKSTEVALGKLIPNTLSREFRSLITTSISKAEKRVIDQVHNFRFSSACITI